jgi:DNA polymerase III epsilon subunit family exonuclease
VFDLELTGLDPSRDQIAEIAIVRVRGGQIVERWSSLVRPTVQMSPGAIAVCGLTDGILSSAPRFHELIPEIRSRFQGAVWVAHNAPFDVGFLHREFDRAGERLDPPVMLDTLDMARRLFAFRKNNLAALAAAFEVALDQHHRALSDAEATAGVLLGMAQVLDPTGAVTVADLNMLLGALAPNSPLRLRQSRVLRDAFRRRRSVWVDYQSTSEPRTGTVRREVAVWLLNLPYVQGWCFLRDGERVFRLDRMLSVRHGDRAYEVPENLSPRI